MPPFQLLLSLPPAMAGRFHALEGWDPADAFADCDRGGPLGSGGGVASLLAGAWMADGDGRTFDQWLVRRPKLVVLAGGQSRRLPSYACVGKVLAPLPYAASEGPANPRHNLLDRILSSLKPVLDALPSSYPVIVTSGDALTLFGPMADLPEVDALGFGFDANPEAASQFGVFFLKRGGSGLDFFLQKPSPERTRILDGTHRFLADTGVWALSARAIELLMRRCGWQGAAFDGGSPSRYELYSQFATALGEHPISPDPEVSSLTSAVVPTGGAFHHFGTSRQLIEFTQKLSGVEGPILQNSAAPTVKGDLWIENAEVSQERTMAGRNVVTNVPSEEWLPDLPEGACLDFQPVAGGWCVRFYGFDDTFSGGAEASTLLNRPALEWFGCRKLAPPVDDLQSASLFPILREPNPAFVAWLVAEHPAEDFGGFYQASEKLSAQELLERADVDRLYTLRADRRNRSLLRYLEDRPREALTSLDLEVLAESLETPPQFEIPTDPLLMIRMPMLQSAILRRRGSPDWERSEAESFSILHDLVVRRDRLAVDPPRNSLLKDQIVWGRSPLRMDLAGGWTDTPPYCMLYGGRVANVAVQLNGQPPIQVFGRVLDEPVVVLRSLDLGTQKRITTYEELTGSFAVGSEFALAQAALALAGFDPRFCRDPESTLERQLQAFGGGVELNVLAAVPKGSGLGTSSILSAAILGTLGSICGHPWDEQDLFDRVLASEQILTTGGGWQDQAGGIHHGLKELTTTPGIDQRITCRWLPERALTGTPALLYYTGIKRVAKDVLREIVRGMFLNSSSRLSVLRDIGANVESVVEASRRGSYEALGMAIAKSWELNKALDPGTSPPEVERVMAEIRDLSLGAKLLGAGGGGYLLILPKDEGASRRVRERLSHMEAPAGARFVDFAVAPKGLDVTRS